MFHNELEILLGDRVEVYLSVGSTCLKVMGILYAYLTENGEVHDLVKFNIIEDNIVYGSFYPTGIERIHGNMIFLKGEES